MQKLFGLRRSWYCNVDGSGSMTTCYWCLVDLALLDAGPAMLQLREVCDLGEETVWTFCGYTCMQRMLQ